MSINLMQTAIDPENSLDPQNTPQALQAMLKDTQGNILKSHGRDHSRHLFFKFSSRNNAGVKQWLRDTTRRYATSAYQQWQDGKARREKGTDGGLFINLCLSASGYKALGLSKDQVPDDPSFRAGAKASIPSLNDPPVDQWQKGFQGRIDALLIVADDDESVLQSTLDQITKDLEKTDGAVTLVHVEKGAVLRVDNNGQVTQDKHFPAHEHFGYADGISQPLFFASDIEASRLNSGDFDKYDPSAPLGLVLLKDPNGGPFGYGAYFVYRKLKQDVRNFKSDSANLADTLVKAVNPNATATEADRELAEAYSVGRFKDGTPVVQQAVNGWLNEPNNWNYDQDVDGLKCPFHAHTRKTNPRGDKARAFGVPPTQERAARIVRRAISYGALDLDPPETEEVGLLFICAQSSIVSQFEFMQSIWSNFEHFLHFDTGLDPVIGQAPFGQKPTTPQNWPKVYGQRDDLGGAVPNQFKGSDPFASYQFTQWVTMQGGEYFFVPSLSFLQNIK